MKESLRQAVAAGLAALLFDGQALPLVGETRVRHSPRVGWRATSTHVGSSCCNSKALGRHVAAAEEDGGSAYGHGDVEADEQ
jgi:hypothetical protein